MTSVIEGMIAGVLAGVPMGLVSEACFRTGLFKSSLVLIDGEFLFRSPNTKPGDLMRYTAGTVIHLITSGIFGGVYVLIIRFLALSASPALLISFYFFVLWLSMLFIALPVAGQGLLGKKAGPGTWFEQLILHIVFGAGYYAFLRMMT